MADGGMLKADGMSEVRYDETEEQVVTEIHEEQTVYDLRRRTTEYALRVIRMFSSLPKTEVARVLGRQVLRSGTSVGAHYREATRARSIAEFISKIGGGQQEIEETAYWLELLVRSDTVPEPKMVALIAETEELAAILSACAKTAKKRKR